MTEPSSPIPPALTPEEWWGLENNGWTPDWLDSLGYPTSIPDGHKHALAATCLYQQPFGFTQEDVTLLRHFAKVARHKADEQIRMSTGVPVALDINPAGAIALADGLDSLLSRISSLLPPPSA